MRFGRLLVLSEVNLGDVRWLCKCDCGNTVVVRGAALRKFYTQSCGCYHKEVVARTGRLYKGCFVKHGHKRQSKQTRAYSIWGCMKTRCFNKNRKDWLNYGGRGITVCDRWKDSFENFLADMGEPPENYQIDRIDNDGNYEPLNCRWVTPKENCNNKQRQAIHSKPS